MVALTGLGFVTAAVNAIIRILLAMGRERVLPRSLSRRHTLVVAIVCVAALALMPGLPLTYTHGGARIRVSRRGAGLSVVLIYLAVNVSAVRAFRTGFRDDFRFCRHLLIPATAIVFLLFPSGGSFTRTAGL